MAAVVCEDQKIRVWTLPDHRLVRTLDLGGAVVNQSLLSDDGSLVLLADVSGTLRIWDTATGAVRMQKTLWPYTAAVAFSRDSKMLALAQANGPAQIFEIASGRKLYELQRPVGGSAALVFSPDGTRIAAADADTVVRMYNARNGELLSRYTDFLLEPLTVAFTPDGKHLATAGGDRVVALLDAANGRLVRNSERQADVVGNLDFSPDGRYLGVALMNSANMNKPAPLMVWETSGRKVAEWSPPGNVLGGGWTTDGRLLVATSTADALHIWRVR
jgi:WD40 repeat protein